MDSVVAHSQEIIDRADALARGLTRFFSGTPCPKGHVAERYVSGGCVECAAARMRTDSVRLQNREYVKAWRAANPERRREMDRARHAANPELRRARERARHAANPEPERARSRARKAANPERELERYRNKRARRRAAEGYHTAADIARIMAAQKCRCAWCGASVKKKHHVDHIQPLALGGSNWPSNLQILCPPCNGRKHAKDPITCAQENGRLL